MTIKFGFDWKLETILSNRADRYRSDLRLKLAADSLTTEGTNG